MNLLGRRALWLSLAMMLIGAVVFMAWAAVIQGTAGSDRLCGTSGSDIFYGYDGDDFINPPSTNPPPNKCQDGQRGGNDVMRGGGGWDTIYGGND
jgi:Ca2+-binding RTX toxin-like protein